MDEDAFLRKLLENPADDVVRLVYADWLEERETDEAKRKAEFLRGQQLKKDAESTPHPQKKRLLKLNKKLRMLADNLPVEWLAIVSHLVIENCVANGSRPLSFVELPLLNFDYKCPNAWEFLKSTDAPTVRYCHECRANVYFAETISEAQQHASMKHCVAVNSALVRRECDLQFPEMPDSVMTMGMIMPTPRGRLRDESEEEGPRFGRIS